MAERTREIGIRLAIGARAREVLLQFLVEALTLSCIGGISGILLAYGLCVILAKDVGAPFLFDPKINIIAFIFSAAIGIIFGFMPARRAAPPRSIPSRHSGMNKPAEIIISKVHESQDLPLGS